MAEKVWIASKHWNKVSYRALSSYELRNQTTFSMSHSVHATREEAMAALVGYRRAALAKAKKELASAERALAKALQMQKEASHG
jgi:cellobiose-specific phosphotransferase system component IIA